MALPPRTVSISFWMPTVPATPPDAAIWWYVQVSVCLPEFIARVSEHMQEVAVLPFGALLSVKQSCKQKNTQLIVTLQQCCQVKLIFTVIKCNSPQIAFFHRVTGQISQWSCLPAYHLPLNLIKASLQCSSLHKNRNGTNSGNVHPDIQHSHIIWEKPEWMCDSLHVKLNVNISPQVRLIIAANLKEEIKYFININEYFPEYYSFQQGYNVNILCSYTQSPFDFGISTHISPPLVLPLLTIRLPTKIKTVQQKGQVQWSPLSLLWKQCLLSAVRLIHEFSAMLWIRRALTKLSWRFLKQFLGDFEVCVFDWSICVEFVQKLLVKKEDYWMPGKVTKICTSHHR